MNSEEMNLGAFSISLSVADLGRSMAFYKTLGFDVTGGDEETWAIMINGPAVIGLFQGMFDNNILTFNPGWDGAGQPVEGDFTDIRQLKSALDGAGVPVEEDPTSTVASGPASFTVVDPDGNTILVDQHV